MKWFKHESTANTNAKLQEIVLDYGFEGYGVYWYCLELISGSVSNENLTFELEHDARLIAKYGGISVTRAEEIMRKMVDLGLFQSSDGKITCLKLASVADDYVSKVIRQKGVQVFESKGVRESPTNSEKVPLEENRLDKKRINNKSIAVDSKESPAKVDKFTSEDYECAKGMLSLLTSRNSNHKKPNLNSWAEDVRKMRELDNRTHEQIAFVFTWAFNDSFWSSNILSPKKLREKFDQLTVKAIKSPTNSNGENCDFITRHTDGSWSDDL